MDTISFGTLLHRYFFFGWLFKDVNRGNLFERSAAWRYNQAQAHWLSCYVRRWMVSGGALLAMGALVELAFGSQCLSAFFYVPGVVTMPISAVVAVAKVGLRVLPGPG